MPPQHRGHLAAANAEAGLQDRRRFPRRQPRRVQIGVSPIHAAVQAARPVRARILAVDGTRIKAVNNKDRNFTRNSLETFIKAVDERLADYLTRLDQGDVAEAATGGARVKNLAAKIEALSKKRGRYDAMLNQLQHTGEDQISLTDPDSRAMAAHTRVAVGYNVQVAVDAKHKLIVEQEVTNQVVDMGLLQATAEPARARIFGSVRHQHPELRRNHVQTLRDVGPDRMHRRAAARAGPVLGLDRDVNARKMGRQRAAVRPALFGPRRRGGLVLLVVSRLAGGDRLLDVLQRQGELARIELLGLAPELHSLELAQKMRETIVLPERSVALDDRGVPLGQRRGQLRLQRIDVGQG